MIGLGREEFPGISAWLFVGEMTEVSGALDLFIYLQIKSHRYQLTLKCNYSHVVSYLYTLYQGRRGRGLVGCL